MKGILILFVLGMILHSIEGQQSFGRAVLFRNDTNSLTYSLNGRTVTVDFKISQGCGDYDCNMTISTISSLTNPSTSNLPSSYSFLSVLPSVIGFSIALFPTSAQLSDFTITVPAVTPPNGRSFSAFIYDTKQQFGILPTDTTATSFTINDWFLVRNTFVFASYSTATQIPLISSQGYTLTGGQVQRLAFGNGVILSVVPSYENAIKMLFSPTNPSGQTFPDGFTSKLFYEIQLRVPTGSQGQINATWIINTPDINGTQLIYYNTQNWSKMEKTSINATLGQFTVNTGQLSGTWMVATPSASSCLTWSFSAILFATLLLFS